MLKDIRGKNCKIRYIIQLDIPAQPIEKHENYYSADNQNKKVKIFAIYSDALSPHDYSPFLLNLSLMYLKMNLTFQLNHYFFKLWLILKVYFLSLEPIHELFSLECSPHLLLQGYFNTYQFQAFKSQ